MIQRLGGLATRRLFFPLTLVLLGFGLPASVSAQYFGRNKVQYESLDFHVLPTPHYQIHFYPEASEAIEDASRMAERWYERIARVFEHEIAEPRPLILYADHPDFQQTNILSGRIGEGTGGVTEGMQDRIILPLGSSYADTDHVLGHEITHSFQFDISSGGQGAGLQALMTVPLWFIEGMAEYVSIGSESSLTAMWVRDALLHDAFPTLEDLTNDPARYFPYRFGHAFWAYVAGRYGDVAVTSMMRNAARAGWAAGVGRVLGVEPDTLGMEWREAMEARYSPLMEGRTPPGEAGALLVSLETGGGRQNLAPSLSPDGRFVVYLSEQDLFTIELFLADARTGEVIRSITSSTRDAHFDALRFLDSSGAWTPDGSAVAVVVYNEGRNQIQMYSVEGDRLRTIEVPSEIGEIRNPTFSPDGTKIAFSGQVGGLTDLYLVDVNTDELTRLTTDRYAQLQPTFSPDGTRIAFVTDLGPATDLDALTFGPMAIGMLSLASGQLERIAPLGTAAHWNPQFTPDGEGLYFLADPDGFRDIYRVSLEEGDVWQVTRIVTGVSGITEATPALSVARETGTVAFTVFDDAQYHIYALDAVETEGAQVSPAGLVADSGARLGATPPLGTSRVEPLLANPDIGLVPPGTYPAAEAEPFDGGLRLAALGQPSIGVGNDYFGTFIGGSVSALFSDLLGDKNLYTALQAQGELKDIGGQVFYQDLGQRWNWGLGSSHVPYRYILRDVQFEPEDVPEAYIGVTDEDRRIFVSEAIGQISYPFSAIRRVEFGGGFTRYGFDTDIETNYYDFFGNWIGRVELAPDSVRKPLNLAEASVAFVEDNSFSGFTGPVRGFRSRFEVGQTTGSATFTSVLADVRRYYSPLQELSFAFRALHFGRYGVDSGRDQILGDIFLGDEYFIHGYAPGSFEVDECIPNNDGTGTCGDLERLRGQRIGVANFEVRIPVLGTERFGLISFPYLPTDLVGFFDAGVAWNEGDGAELVWERTTPERIPVFSTGVGARMNLFGALVLEVYYAYPFQRPEKGAHWGLNFVPGW